MLNKILLALFVLFILTLLGWCSPQCSRQPGNVSAGSTSVTSSDSGTLSSAAAGIANAESNTATPAANSETSAAEIAAEAASTTLDISKEAGASVIEVVKKTGIAETPMPDEPAPQPTDFAAQTSISMKKDGSTDGDSAATTATPTQDTATADTGAEAGGPIAAEAEEISAALAGKTSADNDSGTVVLKGVNFETNSDHLTSDSVAVLDLVVDNLKQNDAVMVEIAGYTDNTGDPAYNVTLSQRRAKAVVDYLTSKGISAEQLSAKGYGAASPIAENGSAAGRKKNRRVEMHVMN